MVKQRVQYETIIEDIPEERRWLDDFFLGREVEVDEALWGTPIESDEKKNSPEPCLTIILNGRAEIYEEYFTKGSKWGADSDREFDGVRAYRPIRIIEKGDILGDFSIIDSALNLDGPSRPRENWKAVYGARSAIFISKEKNVSMNTIRQFIAESKDGEKYESEQAFGEHSFLTKNIISNQKIVKFAKLKIGNIDISKKEEFIKKLIFETSWKRSLTYRSCENSYNISDSFLFSYWARLMTKSLGNNSKRGSSNGNDNRVGYDDFIDIFTDAIFDAINRPTRQEPIYAQCADTSALYDIKNKENGEFLFPFRTTKRKDINRFYFPISSHNFLISNYTQKWKLTEEFKLAFAPKSENNGLVFWKKIADIIIEFHRNPIEYINQNVMDTNKCKQMTEEIRNDKFSEVLIDYDFNVKTEIISTLSGVKELFMIYDRKTAA